MSSVTTMRLLGLMFIGLKLTEEIDWSWWWVLAPFILDFAVFVIEERMKEKKR